MASTSYMRRKQKIRNEHYARMRAAKERKRLEQAEPMMVVGTMTTTGIFGDHYIELLSNDDPLHVWLRVDGVIKKPRTLIGVQKITNE